MKKNHWPAILILLVALSLLAGQVLAEPPQPAPRQVEGLAQGDDSLISRAVDDQSFAAIAYNDDADEYLVVWSDARDGGAEWDIYGQFVSSAGIPQGDNFVIRDESGHGLWYPDVAYDSYNERYLVVWADYTEWDVEGVVLNSDGTAYGAAFNVADGDFGDQRIFPSVASYAHASQGVYAVAYQRGSSGSYDVYARLVNVAGGTTGSELAVSTATGDQTDPDIALGQGTSRFLVVWEDGRDAVDAIWGSLLYATGSLGIEGVISATTIPRANPAVAFSPDAGTAGEWLVVFQRDVNGDDQIGGRRVAVDGTTTGSGIYICEDSGDQTDPDVTYNPTSDQFLVVWEDSRAGASNIDVYGRRVSAAGSTSGATFAINTDAGYQASPAVAASDSGYLVVFDAPDDITGQRVGTDGALQGQPLTISAPLDDQKLPAIAYNTQDGEYLVVWHDNRSGNADIWGQRLDLDGSLLGENFAITSDASGQLFPTVAYNPGVNRYLVVWEDRRTDADIYGRQIEADGTFTDAEFVVAAAGSTARRTPRIAFNPVPDPNEFLVVYTYEAENDNVRAQRVLASGSTAGGEIDVATGATEQNYPDVVTRVPEGGGGGAYLVVWRENDGGQRDVRGQRVSQSGAPLGSPLDLCTQADSQWTPRVAYSPDADHYLVVWPDDRDSATQARNIYGRRVGGAGVLKDELAISTAAEAQAHLAVTYGSGLGNWIVAWDDDRQAGTAPDLYAQQVSGSGALVDANDPIFVYSGWQQFPAVAWAGDEAQGLAVWEDGRNGLSFHIYGLLLGGAGEYRVYLPLVVNNE